MQNPKTVLIVEDEEALLSALVDVFKAEDFSVLSATDGEKGLSLAKSKKPDLILLDVLLPKMSGIDFLEKLRKTPYGKKVEVMLLTNLSDTKTVADALNFNVHNYFVKTDINIKDVVSKVKAKLRV